MLSFIRIYTSMSLSEYRSWYIGGDMSISFSDELNNGSVIYQTYTEKYIAMFPSSNCNVRIKTLKKEIKIIDS